jgi:ubiquinone/menaquinone biosynthesis C-methylase UbiE
MSLDKAYNSWAESYDDMLNKTRDLEEKAARIMLKNAYFDSILELGCGTGKNTQWLAEQCNKLIGLDFSEEMIAKAKQKIPLDKVVLKQQNLEGEWDINKGSIALVSCSLVLEHIEDLNLIFKKVSEVLKNKGEFYLGELHPFKQYSGSKARFDNGSEIQELEVYAHHISEYLTAAKNNQLDLIDLKEWFDEDDRTKIPRLISFRFKKNGF